MQGLIDALAAVKESDLQQIDDKLTAMRNELYALEQVRKVVLAKLGKTAPRPAASKADNFKRPEANPDEEQVPPGMSRADFRRQKIAEYIQKNGPSKTSELANATGIPLGSMSALMAHHTFCDTALGWGLAKNHK